MHNDYHHPASVFSFLAQVQARGTPCVLVAVKDIWGGSLRAKGAVMAVTPDNVAGYISNGCVDADIIFQARLSLNSGSTQVLQYGDGSPFKDIVLPCGGGIDVLVVPNPDKETVETVAGNLARRQVSQFSIGDFEFTYKPNLKVRIVGRGAAARALTKQSLQSGFDVQLQSPDQETKEGIDVQFGHLVDPETPPEVDDDAYTAIVFMFHDHDWEPFMLKQALSGEAFYIGAMGSERTHEVRREKLLTLGIPEQDIDRIRAPIGLIPTMRDANLLALSTLAEIVATGQKRNRL